MTTKNRSTGRPGPNTDECAVTQHTARIERLERYLMEAMEELEDLRHRVRDLEKQVTGHATDQATCF